MFAVRVNEGAERFQARKYTSGTVPQYVSVDVKSMGRKMPVILGYVFTTVSTVAGAERVPESEWRIIQALSSTEPSTLYLSTGKIIAGPLKGLLILDINLMLKAVHIRARLLGQTRDYWLAVRFTENAGEQDRESEGSAKTNLPELEEPMMQAIERAKEIGMHAAAKETGIPWQTIRSAAKKAGIEIVPKKIAKKRTESTEKQTADMPAREKYDTDAIDTLKAENAVLKERITELESQAEKLKRAIRRLT